MEVFSWVWGFYLKTIFVSILIGIVIGQYIAVIGYTGVGVWSDNFVKKIERFIEYDTIHNNS